MLQRRRTKSNLSVAYPILLVLLLFEIVSCNDDYLTTESVVLITGAAGFVGAELAMALHRTYNPKKIICVDSMDNFGRNETLEARLALFDIKRQRAFHLLQVLGNQGHFYRADFRPSIPEYFDVGEVPILDYIFRDHPDISHVVHMADAYHRASANVQAVPRVKQDIKSGMIEALLEQILKVFQETGRKPHLTYASSYEVYNYAFPTPSNPSPFQEELPITTPSTLRGTTKLIDEILARSYQEKYDINSVGLRFFPIYGPWGLPGTPLYEMAELAVKHDPISPLLGALDDVRDYVYIDDAVDAIMAAMQVQPKNAMVVNVGTGDGTTLREIARHMATVLQQQPPEFDNNMSGTKRTEAIASTKRSKAILGFQAQVSWREGIAKLLSWHYDRAFPYGPEKTQLKGVSTCSSFDKECLHGFPVFPCASECSHEAQCTTSFFDDVTSFTASLTEACETVMYTVALDQNLVEIPSSKGPLAADHRSHVKGKFCNIAFVSEMSPLVRLLKQSNDFPYGTTTIEEYRRLEETTGKTSVLFHGFWALVPLPIPSFTVDEEHILSILPKLSPGAFFSAATQWAIYCDPNIAFANVKNLLVQAQMKPSSEGAISATALLVGHQEHTNKKETPLGVNESVQAAAYRMIRIGIMEQMISHPHLESSWMVHAMQAEDSRLFRCDVYGEVVQWRSKKDETSLEFIVGLHDMWARVIARGQGREPWWMGDNATTVRESGRRLTEEIQTEERIKLDAAPLKAFEVELDTTAGESLEGIDPVVAELEGLKHLDELDLKSSSDKEMDSDEQPDDDENRKQESEPIEDEASEGEASGPALRDVSEYDTWMGLVSSTKTNYFVRIVPSSEVGVVVLNEVQEAEE